MLLHLEFRWVRPAPGHSYQVETAPVEFPEEFVHLRPDARVGLTEDSDGVLHPEAVNSEVLLCTDSKGAVAKEWLTYGSDYLPDDLFLRFGSIDPSSTTEILGFADKYGPLRGRTQAEVEAEPGHVEHVFTDTLSDWRREIEDMSLMIAIRQEILEPSLKQARLRYMGKNTEEEESGTTEEQSKVSWTEDSLYGRLHLDEVVRIDETRRRALLQLKAKGSTRTTHSVLFDKAERINPSLEPLVNRENQWVLLLGYVALRLQEKMRDTGFFATVDPSPDEEWNRLRIVPGARDLASWMWYSVATSWSINSDFRCCEWCGMPFLAKPRLRKTGRRQRKHVRARSDMQYCELCQSETRRRPHPKR